MKWLVFSIVCVFAACAKEDGPPKPPMKVAVEVTNEAYVPTRIDVERNQPLTIVFTRTGDSSCGERVVIPSQNIQVDLPLGKPVEVSFTPHDAGTIAFACGMDMLKGAIVVR